MTSRRGGVFPDDATKEELRDVVLSGHEQVRLKLLDRFPSEIESTLDELLYAYRAYRRLEAEARPNERSDYVQAYVYLAFNSLVTSCNLLLSGLLLPAGHLMRHYSESTAMALLCSHPGIDTYNRLKEQPDTFPFHTAMTLVSRRRSKELLGVNGPRWAEFQKLARFYDRFSHASMFAVISQVMIGAHGFLALAGEYDPGKEFAYRIEFKRRASAAKVLAAMTTHLIQRLSSENDETGSSPR